jgi:UDP-2,3-diacylglucosamine pyrophosphatase LpxH
MCETVGHIDIVVCNGDIVEGPDVFAQGVGLTSPSMETQVAVSKKLLQMIDCDEYLFTSGSGYHTKRNPNGDFLVCQMLDGKWLKQNGFFKVDDVTFHMRHWQPYSTTPYARCNSLMKDAYIMDSQGSNVDIYIRSHTHRFNYAGNNKYITISTPCWKGLDDFMNQRSQEIPDNGYIVMDIDGVDYNWSQYVFNIPLQMYNISPLEF